MRHCGGSTCHGHGDFAICGKSYMTGIYQCSHCELLDLKERIMNFTPEYAALQRDFHKQRPDYGVSGHKYSDHIAQLAKKMGTRSILDYGCGKATLQKSLPFPIQNYDPFVQEYTTPPLPADLVVCTDVMEHVEPDFVAGVLHTISQLTIKLAFFQIATRPASKVLPDGRNAHLIQEGVNWWLDKLMFHFNIHHVEDGNGGFIVVVSPLAPKEE